MRTDTEARAEIVQIVRQLFEGGHLTATGGNVSARAAEDGTIWITPRGLYKGGLREADLVRIRADGTVVEGGPRPSIEFRVHVEAYRARPGVGAVVHTHSPVATAFAIAGQSFPPINCDAVFLRETRTVPFLMPGTQELADAVREALAASPGALMRNHGLVAVGGGLREAATRAMVLEETAKVALYVRQFGGAVALVPDADVARLAALGEFV